MDCRSKGTGNRGAGFDTLFTPVLVTLLWATVPCKARYDFHWPSESHYYSLCLDSQTNVELLNDEKNFAEHVHP